jgi:hypothetical protein
MLRAGDLRDLRPSTHAPQSRRGIMAEKRTLTTRQHRCHRPRDRLHPDVADRVDALVNDDQGSGLDAMLDRALAKPEGQQLTTGDVTVLPLRDAGDYR